MSTIQANSYEIKVDETWSDFSSFVEKRNYSKVFILVDENTNEHCYEKIKTEISFEHQLIQINSGEENKTLDTCKIVWNQLLDSGADRKSLLINLGGGVIGDLGGFCAATYMRGIHFIQVPSTLLSQVDASVGGKLGVDLNHFKNMVGVFQDPQMVWVDTNFLSSLPANELRSGYAEVIKHCLIADRKQWQHLRKYESVHEINDWSKIVAESIEIKNKVVTEDPFENGKRKILNFGHTLGHAIESLLLETDHKLLHGEAIAQGMILESRLSHQKGHLSKQELEELTVYILKIYGEMDWKLLDPEKLIQKASKDKKNLAGTIRMASIDQIGSCLYDIAINKDEIKTLFA